MLKVLRLAFSSKNLFIFHTITEEPGETWQSFAKTSKSLKKCSMTSSSLPAPMPSRLRRSLARSLGQMKPPAVNAARDFLRCSPIQTSATSNGALHPWTNRNRCLPLVQAILLMGRGPNKIFVVALVQVRAWTTWDDDVVLKSQELQGANIQVMEAVSVGIEEF